MVNENGQNCNDEIELIAAGNIRWEMKRGSHEIVGAWVDNHHVAPKDFSEEMQIRAHRVVTQQKHKIT